MSVEENKVLLRRFFEEIYNKGNLAVADELVAEGYISHNELDIQVLGPQGIKRAATLQRDAFPKLHTTIEDLIAEWDKVVVRGKDTGTHTGTEFVGIPAKGRRFALTWIDIFGIEDGKLLEAWLETNVESFKRQLGAIPEVGSSEEGSTT
jgi:predicted ester cyclase